MTDAATDRFRGIVYSALAAIGLTYSGWLGVTVTDINDRLIRIETTMVENRRERIGQIQDLRARLSSLEARIYRNPKNRDREVDDAATGEEE